MKTMHKKGLPTALLVAMAWPAVAHTVRSRPASGVVDRLDLAGRTVQFSPKDGKAPTEFALPSQTKFVHNWNVASAGELKSGTKAVVYYRTPFFGKPFVTKVVWVNGS